ALGRNHALGGGVEGCLGLVTNPLEADGDLLGLGLEGAQGVGELLLAGYGLDLFHRRLESVHGPPECFSLFERVHAYRSLIPCPSRCHLASICSSVSPFLRPIARNAGQKPLLDRIRSARSLVILGGPFNGPDEARPGAK